MTLQLYTSRRLRNHAPKKDRTRLDGLSFHQVCLTYLFEAMEEDGEDPKEAWRWYTTAAMEPSCIESMVVKARGACHSKVDQAKVSVNNYCKRMFQCAVKVPARAMVQRYYLSMCFIVRIR